MSELLSRRQWRAATGVVLSAAVLLLTVVGPAAAAPPKTGDRLLIPFEGTAATVYPADTSFWIGHGWCATNAADAKRYRRHATRFELFIDGSRVPLATDMCRNDGACLVSKINFHNFRVGSPVGTHVFTGVWYLDGEVFTSGELEVTFGP